MINEYQGADDKAKGMTKSLSLIQLCKLWLITVLIGLISSCVKEPPENLFHGTILVMQQEVL